MSAGISSKPHVLLMGQTPPPWHGQAVATKILFDHDWQDFEINRLPMEFSADMHDVGRFQFKKIRHLLDLILRARRILKENPRTILFYPPASAKWVPFIRDVIFLSWVRGKAAKTVFIYHASGLAEFTKQNWISQILARRAYGNADMALEVAEEKVAPHIVFHAKQHEWCPCAIEVPELARNPRKQKSPLKILCVGSLQEGKGVLEIIKTASILKQRGVGSDFQFNIVGKWFSPEFEKEALALQRELDVADMVSFTGQLTGDAKWQAYQEADVFFFPTHYQSEATPIVLMEALGMGCPIISTEWAGIPAMLKGCKAAQLFSIHSPEKYADALIKLKNKINQDNDYSEDAMDFYREHFLPEKFIERVERALCAVAKGRALSP
jgi:glycosyltransferase involved in cell wall biosynthesis